MKKSRVDSVMDIIETEKITPRSQVSIFMEKTGYRTILFAVMSVLIIVVGGVFLWLIVNKELLSGYGALGWASFFESFPYLPIVLIFLLVAVITVVMRKFDISYKKPLLGILAGIVVLSIVFALLLSMHPTGKSVLSQGTRMMGMMKSRGSNFVIGTVSAKDAQGVQIQTEEGSIVTVVITPQTHYPFGTPEVGDIIRSVGAWEDDIFMAIGIRVFTDDTFGKGAGGMGTGSGQGKRRMDGSGAGVGNSVAQPSISAEIDSVVIESTPSQERIQNSISPMSTGKARMRMEKQD